MEAVCGGFRSGDFYINTSETADFCLHAFLKKTIDKSMRPPYNPINIYER